MGAGVLRPVYSCQQCCMFWVHVCMNVIEGELGVKARRFWVTMEDVVGRA